MPKIQKTRTPANKDIEQQEFSFIADENAKWHNFGGQFVGGSILTLYVHHVPWYLSKGSENLSSHKNT